MLHSLSSESSALAGQAIANPVVFVLTTDENPVDRALAERSVVEGMASVGVHALSGVEVVPAEYDVRHPQFWPESVRYRAQQADAGGVIMIFSLIRGDQAVYRLFLRDGKQAYFGGESAWEGLGSVRMWSLDAEDLFASIGRKAAQKLSAEGFLAQAQSE
ncbi:hypothetical protein FHR99_003162 [Litorivivens lipolytica]|uniref:Uncharacterized protein n=1 Tax=Litorivivens lipolytica TaxID=1524264 RepID=A0A7W4Z742_9GAMM|nr:hypothetical protein [Litorivivens lipolytica]MBB3048888.1 hypothetical protein [Litorivivens lipolytica]